MSKADPTQGGEAAYIPLGYYADFLKFLSNNRKFIEILTYSDLNWGNDFDYSRGYPYEKQTWDRGLRNGRWDPNKIYLLIQHDVDTRPERTERLLKIEEALGIRSNVMIFRQRVNRRHLQATGELLFTDYNLDYLFLQQLEEQGFEIAYHSNAHEQAHFDMSKAQSILRQDISKLREYFNVRFFSAHGGTPSPEGLNNRDVPLPEDLAKTIRWVHNGASPFFTKSYSDGGINSPKRDPRKRDLRDFVREWHPGGRYRVITHPQYYNDPCSISPRMQGTAWYEEVRHTYNVTGGSAWLDVAPRAIARQCRTERPASCDQEMEALRNRVYAGPQTGWWRRGRAAARRILNKS